LAGDVLDASNHRGEERVLDVRDDRGPDPGVLAAQRAGRAERHVAEVHRGLVDLGGERLADAARAVQHPRHGRRGDTGRLRDVGDLGDVTAGVHSGADRPDRYAFSMVVKTISFPATIDASMIPHRTEIEPWRILR